GDGPLDERPGGGRVDAGQRRYRAQRLRLPRRVPGRVPDRGDRLLGQRVDGRSAEAVRRFGHAEQHGRHRDGGAVGCLADRVEDPGYVVGEGRREDDEHHLHLTTVHNGLQDGGERGRGGGRTEIDRVRRGRRGRGGVGDGRPQRCAQHGYRQPCRVGGI